MFTIYGTKGILKLTDPNQFGGKNTFMANSYDFANQPAWEEIDNVFPYEENSRGIGPAEMADAILTGRKNRADKEMAYHVLDVIDAMMKSSDSGRFEEVNSTCERPLSLTEKL